MVAKNDELESEPTTKVSIRFDSSAYIESVQALEVKSKNENTISLAWKSIPNVDGYCIQPLTNLPYPRIPPINITNASNFVTSKCQIELDLKSSKNENLF